MDMSIYPNPTNGVINIEYQLQLNEPQLLNLYLYDITGRLVKILIDNEQHFSGRYYKVFDESSLPQGIYFYQMQVGSQKIIKKVVRM
jgi:Secretion system C-terminal sorting domain